MNLFGGGQVVFNGEATGFGGEGTLINVDNTIRGNGYINVDLTNQSLIRAESGTLYLGSGVVIDNRPSTTTVRKFVKIEPTSTYLRTANEREVGESPSFPGITDSVAIDLATVLYGEPILPGESIELQRWGDFTFSDSEAQGLGPHGNRTLRGLWGVFSSSDQLEEDPERNNFDRTDSVTPVKRVTGRNSSGIRTESLTD